MNPLLTEIFRRARQRGELTPGRIARTLKAAILDDSLPLGTLLPARTAFVRTLKVPRDSVDLAFALLESTYHLVRRTNSKISVVQVLPEVYQKTPPLSARRLTPAPGRLSFFNGLAVNGLNQEAKLIRNEWRKCIEVAEALPPQARKLQVDQSLVTELRIKVNTALYARYKQEELLYSPDYRQLISLISQLLVSSQQVWAMIRPASREVANAVGSGGKKVCWIDQQEQENWLEALERCCRRYRVGVFYLSSRGGDLRSKPCPADALSRLLVLQKKYRFVIVEDDRYASCHERSFHPLMRLLYGSKADVLYLRSLSLLCDELAAVNIIAGPLRLIGRIRSKLLSVSSLMPAVMAAGLFRMLRTRKLQVLENRMLRAMESARSTAWEILSASGNWKTEGISAGEGSFVHLEPVRGIFIAQAYELLLAQGIYVMNPADYIWGSCPCNRVTLNLISYLREEERLKKDLNKLSEIIMKLIVLS